MPMAEMGVAFTVDRDDFVMLNETCNVGTNSPSRKVIEEVQGHGSRPTAATVFLAMGVSLWMTVDIM